MYTSIPLLAVLAQHVLAQQMLRYQCSQLSIERLDPIFSPGVAQSPYLHQIVGGNSFDATMPPGAFDPAQRSTCTTCSFSEDFSNYWTANLFFRSRNGTFKRVPQMSNVGTRGGGMTVYYIPPYDGRTKVTAFKPVSWSPWVRAVQRWDASDGPRCSHCLPLLIHNRVFACSLATRTCAKHVVSSSRSAIDASITWSRTRLAAHPVQAMTQLLCPEGSAMAASGQP